MAKEIRSIHLTRMNNGAHYLFISKIAARAQEDTTVATKCQEWVEKLKAAAAREAETIGLSQKSLLTDQIVAARSTRRKMFMVYKKAVKGFAGLAEEEMAEAANRLHRQIQDYDISRWMQIDAETGLFTNLLSNLEEHFAKEIRLLSLSMIVANLKEANERVCALTDSRTEERMQQPVGAQKKARKASDEAYRMLVKVVNALALLEDEAPYSPFIDYVNTEIRHYRREVIEAS